MSYRTLPPHEVAVMRHASLLPVVIVTLLLGVLPAGSQEKKEPLFLDPIDVKVPPISTDKTVKYDYDIVYVRALRAGDKIHKRFFTDFSSPVTLEPGADLMLLHPDGSEELLVKGGDGSVTDPVVSLDGKSVYYTLIHNLKNNSQWNPPRQGADIYKMNLQTRKIVRLTNQKFTPNTGAAPWSKDFRTPEQGKSYYEYGVYNMGACPLPGGRLAFTSNRDGFRPAKGYPAIALQLFVMDDSDSDLGPDDLPPNLEKIGHLNVSGALHPVALKDGRIMYSSLESQGIRGDILWGIWTIHPDGTGWNPLVSAFDPGGAPNGFHFETQLSDGNIVVEEYYNQNNSGFGAYIKLPPSPPDGYPAFGSANVNDPRNKAWRYGRFDNGHGKYYRMPFMPTGSVSLTPFTMGLEGPADRSIPKDKDSPAVGKFTHPSAAPDNHLLTCYSPGPVNHQYTFLPQLDGGIYLIKNGEVVNEPAQMRLIKNDPNYNECWPRAVAPYQRIYGIAEPKTLPRLANDGKLSKHLPEGTPFGLVGSSSFYKRESYPHGAVPKGSVTAGYASGNDPWKGLDAFTSHGNGMPLNWHNQGAEAGLYTNDQIHAVRILAMEPTTDRKGAQSGRHFWNHAHERLRVLGEIPLRKFDGDKEPTDPDGNPDTSFLTKIPADTAFTFQTLDKRGMVLNMAQTWHQLRPGEIRTNCGGCHAHSQEPTPFEKTAAAKPDYKVWDLVNSTPLLTDKARDESKKKWDAENEAGLRTVKNGPINVEYHRDIKPILARSCVACHTAKDGKEPTGNLNLDTDDEQVQTEQAGKMPGTYYRLAMDERAKFGHKPIGYDSWGYPNASRYVRMFQSRRSLLTWKVFGERLDGFSNDDFPSEAKPGDRTLMHHGQKIDLEKNRSRWDLDYAGSPMPPPEAVKAGKVKPLSDEDRRTLVRWIDLGCPIDLDYDPQHPEARGYGWMLDDNRPTLALTLPAAGKNAELTRLLVGMHDYGSGLDMKTFSVTADFAIDGVPAGQNLAERFKPKSQGVYELRLEKPVAKLGRGKVTVSIGDKQGNVSRVERSFSAGE
jgi:Hydrazine synthase alpha subunit middle domain